MPPRLPGLIAFDLDGTLIDSRRDLAAAANRLVTEAGGTPLDERTIVSMIGPGAAALVQRAMAAGCGREVATDRDLARFGEIYAELLLETTRPYAGVHEVLRRLARRLPLAVLTNKPVEPAEAILEGLDLSRHFAAVVGDGSGFALKPDPSSLLHLATTVGAAPGDCLYVGDSAIDLRTARDAGTAIALARYGFGYPGIPASALEGDEVLLDRPLELLEYLGLGSGDPPGGSFERSAR